MKSEKYLFIKKGKSKKTTKKPPIERLKRLKKALIYSMSGYPLIMLIVFWIVPPHTFYFLPFYMFIALILVFCALIDVWLLRCLKNVEKQIISKNLPENKQEELMKKLSLKFTVVSVIGQSLAIFCLAMSLIS